MEQTKAEITRLEDETDVLSHEEMLEKVRGLQAYGMSTRRPIKNRQTKKKVTSTQRKSKRKQQRKSRKQK